MSKLFDTLEKIRRQETYHVPKTAGGFQGQNLSGSNRKHKLLTIVLIAGAVLVVAAAALVFRHFLHKTSTDDTIKIITASEQSGKSSKTIPSPQATTKLPATDQVAHEKQAGHIQPPVLNTSTPKAVLSSEQSTELNNLGAETIRAKQDYWKGLYLLNQAKEKDPTRIEPLINMAVALNELGLTGPANRYMAQAYAMNPRHPALQQNLDILARAGQLDGTMKLLSP